MPRDGAALDSVAVVVKRRGECDQVGKERLESRIEQLCVFPQRRTRFGQWIRMPQTAADTSEYLLDHLPSRVGAEQPVCAHVRREAQQFGRQPAAIGLYKMQSVCGQGIDRLAACVVAPALRERMIEVDVDEDAGEAAKWRFEQVAQARDYRMAIGVAVDLPVQRDAVAHAVTPGRIGRAAVKIREQAAELQVGVGAGEEDVGKMVHAETMRASAIIRNPMNTPPAPEHFPETAGTFLIPGPVGALEVATDLPATEGARNGVAVICHPNPVQGGTMTNKVVTTLERALRELGLATARFNFRGVGKSGGEYDHARGEVDDALAIVDWLRRVRPQAALWMAGFSFGGYVAMRAAALCETAQLITVAPAVKRFHTGALAPPACPWLIVQGEADDVVPPREVYAFAARIVPPPDLVKVADTGHFFHGKLIELRSIVHERVRENLPPAAA